MVQNNHDEINDCNQNTDNLGEYKVFYINYTAEAGEVNDIENSDVSYLGTIDFGADLLDGATNAASLHSFNGTAVLADADNEDDNEDDNEANDVALTADTTGVAGTVENFTYAIDSSTADLAAGATITSDITLTGFTVGEDSLTFVDVATGDATTAGLVAEVTVSTSGINNLTDIIFDANAAGDSYQLTLAGVIDADLSTVDMTVA